MTTLRAADHPWLPQASCDVSCLRAGAAAASQPVIVALRVTLASLLAAALPLLAVPLPGRARLHRAYCRLVLRCFGVRMILSGKAISNQGGLLVVSGHVSWLDVFAVGAVLPGSFVARADLFSWPALGIVARIMKVIPIERASLRQLPGVVDIVAARLRAGHTVVVFPEGTTWCGRSGDDAGRLAARGGGTARLRGRAGEPHRAPGPFYPAMFQAAIDAERPVQPLRLTYHHQDGSVSTAPAFIGDDTLLQSMRRLVRARCTVAHVHVESLQLPGSDRRDLAVRCETAVRTVAA